MVNPDDPHSFERLAGTDSCSVCGKQEAEHVFTVYDITDPGRPEYAPPTIERDWSRYCNYCHRDNVETDPHGAYRICADCKSPKSEEPEQNEAPSRWPPSLEDLIDRVALTQEAMQLDQVPLLERVKVLALLKQAQAMERIAAALEDWRLGMKPQSAGTLEQIFKDL